MWAEHERYKNHFLQIQLKHLQPEKINEMVHNEIVKTNKRGYCNTLKSHTGDCKSALYFEDRAELAYGFWALPKLMKELNSDDYLTQWKAINSLSEYVVNPLFAQRAIHQFEIVRRCQNIFLRIRMKFRKVKYREIKHLLVIFYYVAMHRNGASEIINKYRLLDQFYAMICERQRHVNSISNILPFLSQDNENCLHLVDNYKVYDKLWKIWSQDPCNYSYSPNLWLHLTHVLELTPQEAVERGFFEILYKRIHGRLFQYHIWEMKCFGLLLRCHEGQRHFLEVDGIKLLYTILKEEILDSYENVVFALMQGLFSKSILWRCREFTDLPLIVLKLANDSENIKQQLFCLQALREMGVMPVIKRFIKENCLHDIRNLHCKVLNCEKERNDLVYWLEREIYHTTKLRKLTLKLKEIE